MTTLDGESELVKSGKFDEHCYEIPRDFLNILTFDNSYNLIAANTAYMQLNTSY